MILECPSCNAKFTVPDGAIGSDGKQVRCGKCANIWLAKPAGSTAQPATPVVATAPAPVPVATPAATADIPDLDALLSGLAGEDSKAKPKKGKKTAKAGGEKEKRATLGDYKTPVSRKKNPLRIAAYGLVYLILITAAAIVWILKDHPEWLGFESSQGFAFEEMRVERMPQLGGERFTTMPMYKIEGVVRNTSDVPRVRPPIKVTLKNNTGGEVYVKDYPSPTTLIPAGDAVTFTIERLEQPNPKHTHFIVQMANKLEFLLRDVPESAPGAVSKPKLKPAEPKTDSDAQAEAPKPSPEPMPAVESEPKPEPENAQH